MEEELILYIMEEYYEWTKFTPIGFEVGRNPEEAIQRYYRNSSRHNERERRAIPIQIKGFKITLTSLEQKVSS